MLSRVDTCALLFLLLLTAASAAQNTSSADEGTRDANRPLRLAQEAQACPPNSHWGGRQCLCNDGYGSIDNKTCEPLAKLTGCPPNSRWNGEECACDEGYGSIDGNSCISYAAICRRFDKNAFYDPARGDCNCPPGFRVNDAANRCDRIAAEPEPARPAPAPTSQTATTSDEPGDLHIRLNSEGLRDGPPQAIDTSSRRSGNYSVPVEVDCKTVYTTEAAAELLERHKQWGYKLRVKKDAKFGDW